MTAERGTFAYSPENDRLDEVSREGAWQEGQLRTASARQEVLRIASILDLIDSRLQAARRRKRTAAHNFECNRNAAAAKGRLSSPMTQASLTNFERTVRAAQAEAAMIIEEAAPYCDSFNNACNAFRTARLAEQDALRAYMAVRELRELVEEQDRRRTVELRAEMERLEHLKRMEEEQVKRERSWSDNAHYDPEYTEFERLIRRVRPWV